MPKKIRKMKVARLLENARKAGESAETLGTGVSGETQNDSRPGWYPEPKAAVVFNKRKRKGKKGKKKLPVISPVQAGVVDIVDIISPASVNLVRRDYISIDGMYFTYESL